MNNSAVRTASHSILILAQIEALRLLLEPLLEQSMGKGEPEKEYMRLTGESCEKLLMSLGDSNPQFHALVSADIEALKAELRRRA
jgi:hypothetical protein